MTKSELIEQVSEKLKLPNGKAEQIVNCVFDSMVKALQEGEGIEIRGLGSFTVRRYKSYEGRNPRTGETVHVEPKRLPFFKVGKDLRERVNAAAERRAAARAAAAELQRQGAQSRQPPMTAAPRPELPDSSRTLSNEPRGSTESLGTSPDRDPEYSGSSLSPATLPEPGSS